MTLSVMTLPVMTLPVMTLPVMTLSASSPGNERVARGSTHAVGDRNVGIMWQVTEKVTGPQRLLSLVTDGGAAAPAVRLYDFGA
jgi:hypothetical protein